MMDQDATETQSTTTQDDYRSEIEAALQNDTQRIGDVWRERRPDRKPEDIRVALELGTVGAVHINLGSIETLLECKVLSRAPTLVAQRARMLRNFVRRHGDLSAATKNRLELLAIQHQQIADDKGTALADAEQVATGEGSLKGPGIYVYTLEHYLNHPVDPTDDDESNPRTYLKVGVSEVDVEKRVKQQQTTTGLPEPILPLRRYVLAKEAETKYGPLEKRIHAHLNAADHNQNRRRGAGTEWFLTHLFFVDSTANLLGLRPAYEAAGYATQVEFD